MKVTLCVLGALVAVTSAANCAGTVKWCPSTACKCDTDSSSDDCSATNKYCSNPGTANGAILDVCSNVAGTAALKADCACGAATVVAPAAAKATFSATPSNTAPQFCLLSKSGSGSSAVANGRASADTCPGSATSAN